LLDSSRFLQLQALLTVEHGATNQQSEHRNTNRQQ
jgi:hypothetical protein